MWKVRLICCGQEIAPEIFLEWGEADEFREFWSTHGGGHERQGIIEAY